MGHLSESRQQRGRRNAGFHDFRPRLVSTSCFTAQGPDSVWNPYEAHTVDDLLNPALF